MERHHTTNRNNLFNHTILILTKEQAMLESIKEVLMRRDKLTESEANNLISEAREALQEYLSNDDQDAAYNICEEYFNLEPDYLFELL